MNNFFKQSEAMINRTLDNQYIGITIKVLLGYMRQLQHLNYQELVLNY